MGEVGTYNKINVSIQFTLPFQIEGGTTTRLVELWPCSTSDLGSILHSSALRVEFTHPGCDHVGLLHVLLLHPDIDVCKLIDQYNLPLVCK